MSDLAIRLVRLCFGAATEAQPAPVSLASYSNDDWRRAFALLEPHRLIAFSAYALEQTGAIEAVPEDLARSIRVARRNEQLKSHIRFISLKAALKALQQRGIDPIVMKGVLLADTFYPDAGTRPMSDIDFVIEGACSSEAHDALLEAGFRPRTDHTGKDAYYLVDALGVMYDIHFRFRIFEGKGDRGMVIQPKRIDHDRMRVLEPSAMLAHLVVHMNGHRDETGPILIWYLDLALVVAHWGDRIEAEHLFELMPSAAERAHLADTLAFLRDELGQTLPPSLARIASARSPERLESALAQRYLAMWGLPGLRGWVRLLVARAKLGKRSDWLIPRNRELPAWLWDGALLPRLRKSQRLLQRLSE